jgi:hypothetical protein
MSALRLKAATPDRVKSLDVSDQARRAHIAAPDDPQFPFYIGAIVDVFPLKISNAYAASNTIQIYL